MWTRDEYERLREITLDDSTYCTHGISLDDSCTECAEASEFLDEEDLK